MLYLPSLTREYGREAQEAQVLIPGPSSICRALLYTADMHKHDSIYSYLLICPCSSSHHFLHVSFRYLFHESFPRRTSHFLNERSHVRIHLLHLLDFTPHLHVLLQTAAMVVDLKDKTIIITGGAQGLGASCVQVLVQQGAKVYSFDIKDEAGEVVAKGATAAGPGEALYRHVDISRRTEVFNAVEAAAKESGGKLHAVVNIAGIGGVTALLDISEEELDLNFGIHLKGMVFICQAAHPFFKANGIGFIVNCASDAAIAGVPGTSPYAAAKGSVIALTRTMSMEWGPDEIRANVINPVAFSGMLESVEATSPERHKKMQEEIKARCPLGGKKGDPAKDIAPVVAFLCSDAARWVSGQLIPVNGGMTNAR